VPKSGFILSTSEFEQEAAEKAETSDLISAPSAYSCSIDLLLHVFESPVNSRAATCEAARAFHNHNKRCLMAGQALFDTVILEPHQKSLLGLVFSNMDQRRSLVLGQIIEARFDNLTAIIADRKCGALRLLIH
jgi:hypothetical protein